MSTFPTHAIPVPALPLSPPEADAASGISVEEFISRSHGASVELVKGVIKELPMPGFRHGKICVRIAALILHHADANDLGHVASNDSFVRTGPATVRGGDLLFFGYDRLPRETVPDGLPTVSPDLVVEVKSPTDRWAEIFTKVGEYLGAGVRSVVVIDPESSTVSVYRPETLQRILTMADTLELPDILPSFSVPVERIFA